MKDPDPAIAADKSIREHLATARGAFGKSDASLFRRATSAVERGRQPDVRGGKAHPFAADVMDVREDGSDGPCAAWWFGAPRAWIEILEDDLVHAVIYGEALDQALTAIERHHFGCGL